MTTPQPLSIQLESLFNKHMDITGGYDIYDTPKLKEDIATLITDLVEECLPEEAVKPPKDQPHYQEAIYWQHGYNQALAEIRQSLNSKLGVRNG